MRPVSSAFDVSEPHTFAVSAVLLDTDEALPVLEGSVTLDSNAEIRGTCDLRIAYDGTRVPVDKDSELAPFGNEIQLYRGIEYPDGETELVSLGIYLIQQTKVSDVGSELALSVSGLDRAKRYVDAQFTAPLDVPSGSDPIDKITEILEDAYPLETDFPTTTHTTPHLIAQEGENRWAFCQGIAKWLGAELYFDADGIAVITTVSTSGTSVFTLSEGAGGTLLSVDADWDREPAFNWAIVAGENVGETGAIPRGEAKDEDTDSPTYWAGDFGPKPIFFSSEFVTSDAMAGDAAEALLAKNMGIAKAVNFGAVVHPALEPLDTITVNRPRAGITNETLILDSLTIPLEAEGTMNGQTRTVRVT